MTTTSTAAGAVAHPSDGRALTGRRVAVVGAGMIAAVHLRSARLAGAELVGVMSSTPGRSAEVARAWRAPAASSTIEEVAASDADVVRVCTPSATHAPCAEALLQAGEHVVCEEPLGVSVAEAERTAALAERSGPVATVPFVYRYHPVVRELRARVLAGHAQGYADCFDAFVADTCAAIDGEGREGLPTFADGLRSARIVDAVLRSARTQGWTEV